jgi:hypothetical protein
MENFLKINELLAKKARVSASLSLHPYTGSVEIKKRGEKKYLYVRQSSNGKRKSQYVGIYSEELYLALLKSTKDARELKKSISAIDKELEKLRYRQTELSPEVSVNIDFARANMKMSIYEQAVLEGVATSYPQTEDIIENGIVSGMTAGDINKILNLKHAWEFILDEDIIKSEPCLGLLSQIAKIINEGFFRDGGAIRSVPVRIGGSDYVPPIPTEREVRDSLDRILKGDREVIDKAIALCMYCMKTQVFIDGNKRAAIIFANHFLISNGGGLLVVPEKKVKEFKTILIKNYEGAPDSELKKFYRKYCWQKLG